MRTNVIVVAMLALLATWPDARANDEKPARRVPPAQRAKNMTELYLETVPSALPGGVPVGPSPVTPLGGGGDERTGDKPEPTSAAPGPKPPADKPSAPKPDPVPAGESAPPAPSGPVPPPPSGQWPCPT